MLSGEGSPSQFDDDIRGFAVEVGIDPAVAILVHRLDEVHQIPGSCNIVRWDHFFAFFAKSPFRFPHQTRTIIASGNSSFSAVTEVTEEAWRTAILALMSLLGVCLNEWWSEWSEVVVATYAPLAYSSAVVFVETPIFSRRVGNYLDDDENGRLQSFPAPELLPVTFTPLGEAVLSWSTVPGRTYRLEFKEDLAHPLWQALGQTTASGAALSLADSGSIGKPQRFYRVVLLP